MANKPIPLGMTTEEFKRHLDIMRDRVINFKDYGGSVVGTRVDRSYANQKRGNFHGNMQKNARNGLRELNANVRIKRSKWDG